MAFSFGEGISFGGGAKAKTVKPAKLDPVKLTEEEIEYRERAKAERERRKLATDSDYYSVICFKAAADRAAFLAEVGMEGPYLPGEALCEALAGRLPERNRRTPPRKYGGGALPPDPYAAVEYTGDLSADCVAEAMALLAAFKARRDEPEYRNPYDSPYWVCAVFRSMDDMHSKWLDRFGLWRLGDIYLDGSALLRMMA